MSVYIPATTTPPVRTAANAAATIPTWELSDLAGGCYQPDDNTLGHEFLHDAYHAGITTWVEAINSDPQVSLGEGLGSWNDDYSDLIFQAADSAIPVYSRDQWKIFTDLHLWTVEDDFDTCGDSLEEKMLSLLSGVAQRVAELGWLRAASAYELLTPILHPDRKEEPTVDA